MKNFLARVRNSLVAFFPFFVGLLMVANMIVAFSVYRTAHPRYFYHTSEVTNYIYSVTTSYLAVASIPSNSSVTNSTSSSTSLPSPSSFNKPYDYFVLSSLRMARMDGITYSEGDVCSRGLILRIFPDRIFLHNGDVIENASYPSNRHPQKKELVNHDRRTVR